MKTKFDAAVAILDKLINASLFELEWKRDRKTAQALSDAWGTIREAAERDLCAEDGGGGGEPMSFETLIQAATQGQRALAEFVKAYHDRQNSTAGEFTVRELEHFFYAKESAERAMDILHKIPDHMQTTATLVEIPEHVKKALCRELHSIYWALLSITGRYQDPRPGTPQKQERSAEDDPHAIDCTER